MTPPNWRQLTIPPPCDRLLGMKNLFKKLFKKFAVVFDRNVFDLGPGRRQIQDSYTDMSSFDDGWRTDCENLSGDFQRAINRFKAEYNV